MKILFTCGAQGCASTLNRNVRKLILPLMSIVSLIQLLVMTPWTSYGYLLDLLPRSIAFLRNLFPHDNRETLKFWQAKSIKLYKRTIQLPQSHICLINYIHHTVITQEKSGIRAVSFVHDQGDHNRAHLVVSPTSKRTHSVVSLTSNRNHLHSFTHLHITFLPCVNLWSLVGPTKLAIRNRT
ncbi:hypothetical protein L9F63_002129, partial [Diploptera punctata]